jgi:hypothetical protein
MSKYFLHALLVMCTVVAIVLYFINIVPAQPAAAALGDATISRIYKALPVTIKTSNRFAGAIYSLTWDGQQFINSYDHGRELQSAMTLDGRGEAYNPTEAGSVQDGAGADSTSILKTISVVGDVIKTYSRMAFWRPVSGVAVSPDYLNKQVTLGFNAIPNVVEHLVTFSITDYTKHKSGQFEALTAYMPYRFSKFWTYDPTTKTLAALSDGPGEQNLPVIFSTPDGSYAMGIYSPGLPQPGYTSAGYGRWRFPSATPANATVKMNCVYRVAQITKQNYSFRCFSIFGTLTDVKTGINKLDTLFHPVDLNQAPIGNFETISSDGLIQGWTYDPDVSSSSVDIEIYADGPIGVGALVGSDIANVPRLDVNTAKGVAGDHGFSFAIPDQYKTGSHTYYVYGVDENNTKPALIPGSPRSFGPIATSTTI